MDIYIGDNKTAYFEGILNEEIPLETIKSTLSKALEHSNTIYLDFSNVKRANSYGILCWNKILQQIEGQFVYINAPVWLVEHINISDLLNGKSWIKSFQAPFYCPQTNTQEVVTLELEKDIPILSNYEDYNFSLQNKAGFPLEIDFEPNEYFYFIIANPTRCSNFPHV